MTRDALPKEFPEPERYELHEEAGYRFRLDRRDFVHVLGAGVLLSTTAGTSLGQHSSAEAPSQIGHRLHIGADGTMTVMTGKVEVGQGSRTQLSMAAAEELRVPLAKIRLIMADSALVPDDGGTAGSRTTPSTVPRVRKACAAARRLLLRTAAERWQVDADSLGVKEGRVVGPSPDQVLSYAGLTSESSTGALQAHVGPEITVSQVSEWTILGTSVSKLGARAIVTGAHRYPSDHVLPGMLYGRVLRPPAYGATPEFIDLAPARAMQGVTAVHDANLVAFAAPTSAEADRAMRAVASSARWTRPDQQPPSSRELYDSLKKSTSDRPPRVRSKGSLEAGLQAARKTLRQTYGVSYIQHAPMEPRAAVASWEKGSLTVWTGTQQPNRVRREVASAFHLAEEKVRLIVPDTGGGFGGKHTGEVAVEAARLARSAKRPVSLRWTREEEFAWAYFRPAGVIEILGGMDASGSICAWEQINYNSGASAITTPYDVENSLTRFHYCDAPLRQGSYRALASTANIFARESFMDELAGPDVDALEFRLRHLRHARLRAVLEAATQRFQWARRKKEPNRRGVGLACGTEKGSYVACCAEVEVDSASGDFRVVEVCQAYECGAIQNPANLRVQVEGCIIQGLGGALKEKIHFRNGAISNPTFSSYAVPRFKDVPRIEVVLVNRPDLPSVGGSETPIVGVAPAIANALFAATGERRRFLPLDEAG